MSSAQATTTSNAWQGRFRLGVLIPWRMPVLTAWAALAEVVAASW